jgi:glycosyltransferase involved in cell wall biosynthesis
MLDPWSLGHKALKKRAYLALIERQNINRATRLLFTSRAERDLASLAAGPLPVAEVIALGADSLPASRTRLKSDFFLRHPDLIGRQLLIFMGRIHQKKRPEVALEALARIANNWPRTTLLFVGSGDEAYMRRLYDLADGWNLGSRVRFLGQQYGVEKWQALAASDIFVLPSKQENFAIAAAEALKAGVPAILSRHINISAEVAEAGAGMVIEERDLCINLSNALVSMLTDPPRLADMARRAALWASAAYDWDVCGTRTFSLYETILKRC